MSGISRRSFLAGAGVGLASAMARLRGARAITGAPPHYMIHIILSGGFDNLLLFDPKEPRQVTLDTEIGYRANERLMGGRRMYGPLFGDLLRHEADLCLVHGVRIDTVSHDEGHFSIARGRIAYSSSTPAFGDVMGAALAGTAPVRHLATQNNNGLYPLSARAYEPTALKVPRRLTDALFTNSSVNFERPGWADVVEENRLERGQRAFADDPLQAKDYSNAAVQAKQFSQFLAPLPRESPFKDRHLGPELQLALQAIKMNFSRFVSVASFPLWLDSHADNFRIQKTRLPSAIADIARLFDLLKSERNQYGPLSEQTTVVVGSELGRFPKLNATQGKDHWPENTWLLFGRGIRRDPGGLTMGATDTKLRGLEVDYSTGSLSSGNRRPIFLDSIYATLVRIAGGAPSSFGYSNNAVLDFVIG